MIRKYDDNNQSLAVFPQAFLPIKFYNRPNLGHQKHGNPLTSDLRQ